MENSAFRRSKIVRSNIINGVNIHIYGEGQPGKPNTEYRISDVEEIQQTQGPSSPERRRVVAFVEEVTGRALRSSGVEWSETSQIPLNISRLRNTREESTHDQSPGPAYSIGSSYSVSAKTTTTGGRPASHFKAIEENRDTLEGHLNVRVSDSGIRGYMRSRFFSDAAIPLWEPSPSFNSPAGIETSNVCVGDVGFFTPGGGFYVLFNAFLSFAENRDIGFDPPPDFEPYGPVRFAGDVSAATLIPYTEYVPIYGDFKPEAEIPRHSERTYISSYHLVKKKPKNLRSGTVLDLPNGFWRDRMLVRVILAMQNYFNLHAEDWYNYYLKQPSGPTIPKGHLHIVTGSYKCSAWALAYCSTLSPEDVFARLYKIDPDSEIFYHWERRGPVMGRRGPHSANFGRDGLPLKNQCVAVEVYSIVKTKGLQKVRKKTGASISKVMSRLSIWSRGTAT